MDRTFPITLSALRQEKGLTQRQAAALFGISQGLLSHYENGMREPGLDFIKHACSLYGVSADYLLCLSDDPRGGVKQDYSSLKQIIDEFKTLTGRASGILEELEK